MECFSKKLPYENEADFEAFLDAVRKAGLKLRATLYIVVFARTPGLKISCQNVEFGQIAEYTL